MTNLTQLLNIAAVRSEDRPMLVYRDRPVMHADLAAESRRLATGLRDLGIGRGDRVAFWLPNAPAYLAMFFACARIGAIALAVNTRYRASEVADIVGRAGAKAMIYWPDFKGIDFAGMLATIDLAEMPELKHLIVYSEANAPIQSPLSGVTATGYDQLNSADQMLDDHADDGLGCAIFTTSGTTSKPKFVLHHQSSIADHALQIAEAFDWRRPDITHMVAMPYCGVFGLTQVMGAIASGRMTVTMPYLDIPETVRLMRDYNVTHTAGSDDMYNLLLDATEEPRPFPHFRVGIYGAFNAALDNIVEKAQARGMYLTGVYGMSEVQALFSRWPEGSSIDVRKRAGGVPIGSRAGWRVCDTETGELLGIGKPGELLLRGPSMLMAYFQNPEATAAAITEDGYIRTGDLAMLTEDGGFHYLSRMGDVLRLGGFLVAPAEIEACVLDHPAIRDVQVVGVSADGRNRAVACVIADDSFDEAEVIALCAAQLAKYKVPARVLRLDSFPTTPSPNGVKIQKNKLREMAEAAFGSGA